MALRASLSDRLMLGFRRLPVSWLLLLTCALVHGSVVYLTLFPQEQGSEGLRLGTLDVRHLVAYPEVDGFIELWQGQWWRVPISALHHGDLFHLVCNGIGLWILGGMLEPRLGRVRYALFVLGGLFVCLLPEVAVEQPAIGISGVLYAMFGLLLVLRTRDEWIRERFHPSLITWGFLWLFLCIPLTLLELMPVANGGHLCGIVYGALVGWLGWIVLPQRRVTGWLSLAAVHAAIVAGFLALMAPTWNGRYWGWRAVTEGRPALWLQAVQRDPRMITGWIAMIENRRAEGDLDGAWLAALQGAKANRSSTVFDDEVRSLFRKEFASAEDRARALDALQSLYGDEADAWLRRFRLPLLVPPDDEAPEAFVELPPLETPLDAWGDFFGLTQHVRGITRPHENPLQKPTIDPDDPHSARFGEVL